MGTLLSKSVHGHLATNEVYENTYCIVYDVGQCDWSSNQVTLIPFDLHSSSHKPEEVC